MDWSSIQTLLSDIWGGIKTCAPYAFFITTGVIIAGACLALKKGEHISPWINKGMWVLVTAGLFGLIESTITLLVNIGG